jgi:uncharacterized protein (TIGR02611 family)
MNEPRATSHAPSPPAAGPGAQDDPPREVSRHPTIAKLHKRRERHRQRGRVVRWAVVLVGALVTLAGILMTGPIPGPGFLIIPIGLALLALEFVWAERLLERAVIWADKAKAQAAARSRPQKIASAALAAVAVAAFVVAAILWDIPLLPV